MKRLERGKYLGGHEAAAISGVHPYMTRMDVYAACAGGHKRDISNDPAVRRGSIIEPGFLTWIEKQVREEQRGIREVDFRRDVFIVDDKIGYFAGTLDAIEYVDGVPHHIHEATSTTSRSLGSWGEHGSPTGAAAYKWTQAQWYLANSGAASATVWLFVTDTGEIRRYPVIRNEEAISSIRNVCEEFWINHILTSTPPEITAGMDNVTLSRMERALDLIYRGDKEAPPVEATEDLVAAANDYDEARLAMNEAEERKRAASARIKDAMKDGTKAKWSGGSVSWVRNKSSTTVDYESLVQRMITRFSLDEAVVATLKKEETVEKDGPRVLRVTIKEA